MTAVVAAHQPYVLSFTPSAKTNRIAWPAQPVVQASGEPAGTLYVVNSQSSSSQAVPRLAGLLSGFQLQPPSFQVNDAGQAFPSVFSSRFFNSDLSSWCGRATACFLCLMLPWLHYTPYHPATTHTQASAPQRLTFQA